MLSYYFTTGCHVTSKDRQLLPAPTRAGSSTNNSSVLFLKTCPCLSLLVKNHLTTGKIHLLCKFNCFIVVKMHFFMPDTCVAAEQYQCILVRDKLV